MQTIKADEIQDYINDLIKCQYQDGDDDGVDILEEVVELLELAEGDIDMREDVVERYIGCQPYCWMVIPNAKELEERGDREICVEFLDGRRVTAPLCFTNTEEEPRYNNSMQTIIISDYDTIYTAAAQMEGPDGCFFKGDKFQIVDFAKPSSSDETAKALGATGVFIAQLVDDLVGFEFQFYYKATTPGIGKIISC